MSDQEIAADADDSLRLEDVGRRSACDRCRGMKTRCERPHNHAIAQLQQCRRCRKANVRCITTLEGQHQSNDGEDRTTQKRRKQEMEEADDPSVKLSRGQPAVKTPTSLKEQAYGMLVDFGQRPMPTLPAMPIEAELSNNIYTPYELDFQWFDEDKAPQFQGGAAYRLGKDKSESIFIHTAETSELSSPSQRTSDSDLSVSGMNSLPQSDFTEYLLNHGQQENDMMVWDNLTTSTQSTSSDYAFPTTGTTEAVMQRLVEFNGQVVHDMHAMKWGTTNLVAEHMLAKTLHHSKLFMELLRVLIRPLDAGPSDGDISPLTLNARPTEEKIDNDMALLLLSSKLNVIRMYETLCIVLGTQKGQDEEAQMQHANGNGLEYLQGLDVDMRVQASVHICSLAFVQIRNMFDRIQRQGMLTKSAATTFHAMLGGEQHEPRRSSVDTTSIVESLQKLVMGRRC